MMWSRRDHSTLSIEIHFIMLRYIKGLHLGNIGQCYAIAAESAAAAACLFDGHIGDAGDW